MRLQDASFYRESVEEAAGESEDSQYDPEEVIEEEEEVYPSEATFHKSPHEAKKNNFEFVDVEEAAGESEDSRYDPEEVIEEEEEVYPSEATFHKSPPDDLELVSNGSDDLQRSVSATETASQHQEQSRKRRRSRWDTNPKCGAASEPGSSGKRRISRWEPQPEPKCPIELPDFAKKLSESWDPETQELRAMLFENERLQREGAQEAKSLEKLVQERQIIIARLVVKNALSNNAPSNNAASKNAPSNAPETKLSKKLYIPVKEYPDYNFVGLIIGPRGHSLKRMMKETGAEIVLRGKNSSKQKGKLKVGPSDDEDLHVLIQADDQKSLDDAVGRVEKLLVPIEESANEHKRAQLRELGRLTDTLKNTACGTCGEVDHTVNFCPKKESVFVKNPECDTCGGSSHSTAMCPLTITTPGTGSTLGKQPQKGVLGDLGGAGGFTFSTPQTSSNIPWQGSGTVIGTAPIVDDRSNKKNEDGRLLVSNLPPSADHSRLRELFTSFGRLVEASVIKEKTGRSKGYGFVKYEDPLNAAVAAAHMNGYIIGGKKLRVSNNSGDIPSSTSPSVSFQSSTMTSETSPTPVSWPRPPVSAPVHSTTSLLSLYQGSSTTYQISPSPVSWPRPLVPAPVPSSTTPLSLLRGSPMMSQSSLLPRPPPSAPVPSSTSFPPRYPDSTTRYTPSPAAWPGPPGSMLSDPQLLSTNSGLYSSDALANFPGNPDRKIQQSSFLAPSGSVTPRAYLTPSPRSAALPFSWPPVYPH